MNVSLEQAVATLGDDGAMLDVPGEGWSDKTPRRMDRWRDHVDSWTDAPAAPLLLLRYEEI